MKYSYLGFLKQFSFLLLAGTVFAAESNPTPYVGEVTGNRVNVRAGKGINYRIMKVASKSDKLIVREIKDGWARIDVPKKIQLFISKKYVKQGANGTGTVTGSSVNVRPTPSLRHPALCQVKKGDTVKIFGTEGKFFKIGPPEKSSAWISAKYVRFYGNVEKMVATALADG